MSTRSSLAASGQLPVGTPTVRLGYYNLLPRFEVDASYFASPACEWDFVTAQCVTTSSTVRLGLEWGNQLGISDWTQSLPRSSVLLLTTAGRLMEPCRLEYAGLQQIFGDPDESLRSDISDLLSALEQFPSCYNQALLSGSLAYCLRALRRGAGTHVDLYDLIDRYVSLIKSSTLPYVGDVPVGWTKLDFTLYSDRFDTIQRLCAERSVLPTLEDLTIEDVQED